MAMFKEGDVVQLKSGGPKMTVASVKEGEVGGAYYCKWFNGKKIESGRFSEITLVAAEESK